MKVVPLKWVFKIYCARLVALGYRQHTGIDYTDIHAPVLHEVVLRIMILIKLIMGWKIKKIDVEAAFLDSKLDELLHVVLPEGWKEIDDKV